MKTQLLCTFTNKKEYENIVKDIKRVEEKIIVFNHRPDTYKHYKEFLMIVLCR